MKVPPARPHSCHTRTRYSVLGTRYCFFLSAILLSSRLSAQSTLADSLWTAGNYPAAEVEYTRSLHDNPGYVRALYRLAILRAWDGQLDSALALLRDAREVEPREPDVRLWEAKVLTWQGQYRPALARYDSLIHEAPRNHDARFGRAQALAWSGQSAEADRELQALIAEDPGDADALFALAQLRLWQDHTAEADHYNELALRAAPGNRDAQRLRAQIRALRRPRLEVALGWSHDSDHNNAWWQSVGTSLTVAPGLRAFGSAGVYEASDPTENGTRVSGEAGASWSIGDASFTGALGGRRLTSDSGVNRSLGTWRAAASYRIGPGAGLGVGYAHYSFDETAFLLAHDLDIDELSADGDFELTQRLSLGVGGGLGYISDNNHRKSLVAALQQRLTAPLVVGIYARAVWYDFKGNGYFSPDRFLLGEIRSALTHAIGKWDTRLTGGLGIQQSGAGTTTDAEWHLDARVARRWGTINEVALAGAVTNSAISSASGAFHYYTALLTLRLGL